MVDFVGRCTAGSAMAVMFVAATGRGGSGAVLRRL